MSLDYSRSIITSDILMEYQNYLKEQEHSQNTIVKYLHDIKLLQSSLGGHIITKEAVVKWKESLIGSYAISSINSMIAAVNHFLNWLGKELFRIKAMRIQKTTYTQKELTKEEYVRLLKAANGNNNTRLALILQTICGTGIRISELQYITFEACMEGKTVVNCKNKSRLVFLPQKLCILLKEYCKKNNIITGIVFCTKKGNALNRSNIWREMKQLCKDAQVDEKKVFPHNLRHLFARSYYAMEKDLFRLADILGHSNVNTTRIYMMESGVEHARQIERMDLIFLSQENTT